MTSPDAHSREDTMQTEWFDVVDEVCRRNGPALSYGRGTAARGRARGQVL